MSLVSSLSGPIYTSHATDCLHFHADCQLTLLLIYKHNSCAAACSREHHKHTTCTDIDLVLQDVAEFTTTCERYVGTESGGMDQAISMMGMPQIAKLIEFNPVSSCSC